jgi:hypothetical protein
MNANGLIVLGQKLLERAAEDVLNAGPDELATFCRYPHTRERERLVASLELDGYVFLNGRLRPPEGEAQEVEAERGELETMYASLRLGNVAIVKHHLKLCDEHYATGGDKAGDCIHPARQYLEQVLADVAVTTSSQDMGS